MLKTYLKNWLVRRGSAFRTLCSMVRLPSSLALSLRGGQIVVMDNLSSHKGERVRELIEEKRAEVLLFLPPYSPDLNPLEEAFSKIKGFIGKAEARTREALVEAMGAAISAITARDARGFFEHCGYVASAQSL